MVYSWYHRQFREVAEEYFLGDAAFEEEIHSMLVDYFIGRLEKLICHCSFDTVSVQDNCKANEEFLSYQF